MNPLSPQSLATPRFGSLVLNPDIQSRGAPLTVRWDYGNFGDVYYFDDKKLEPEWLTHNRAIEQVEKNALSERYKTPKDGVNVLANVLVAVSSPQATGTRGNLYDAIKREVPGMSESLLEQLKTGNYNVEIGEGQPDDFAGQRFRPQLVKKADELVTNAAPATNPDDGVPAWLQGLTPEPAPSDIRPAPTATQTPPASGLTRPCWLGGEGDWLGRKK